MTTLTFIKRGLTNRNVADFVVCVEHDKYEDALWVLADMCRRAYGNDRISPEDMAELVSDMLEADNLEQSLRDTAKMIKLGLVEAPPLEEFLGS